MREELDTYNFVPINDSENNSINEMPVDIDNCPNLSVHEDKTPPLNTIISDMKDNLELECGNDNYVLNNVQLYNESGSSSSSNLSDHLMTKYYCINSEIAQWALLHKISHTAVNGLLSLLRKHKCFTNLPKDARTILHTKPVQIQSVRDVHPVKYHHFGLEIGMNRHLSNENTLQTEIKVVIGIDGLPISKSN
jgi:hypothetical protein